VEVVLAPAPASAAQRRVPGRRPVGGAASSSQRYLGYFLGPVPIPFAQPLDLSNGKLPPQIETILIAESFQPAFYDDLPRGALASALRHSRPLAHWDAPPQPASDYDQIDAFYLPFRLRRPARPGPGITIYGPESSPAS
jgi:hypothetical protein